ncbi:Hypothetical predicted protein [Cloeon dipterum]|uniref:Uncharacterized protein n=1 Tax=Cloeon dipterum TaxID=197152 RepID=A0A8S1CNB0_9INSE|nr:Hypothetical predicted protein [Cloeon dipterum]
MNITKKDKTCGISSGNVKVFNMFSMNKQQTTKKGWNNSFPLNDSSIGKSLYPLAYFADCWFRAKGVINNETGEIDAAALATFITTNQTDYWANVLGEAATACVEVVTAMSPPLFAKDKKSSTSSTAFFVAQCLAFVSIEYCETKLTTTSCNKDYAMFDTCKNYLYQELANNGGSKLKSAVSKSSSLRGAKKAAKLQVQGRRSDPSNSTTTEATTETEMPTTTKKTTTTKPPNCAGANYEKIRRCCSEPPAIFINITNKKDKTCGISASNIKVFNTFILNKQQSTKKGWQNTVLINNTGVGRSLYPLAYFADCWLRAKGVMDNETREVNSIGLPVYFTTNQSSYWSYNIVNTASDCLNSVQDYSSPNFVKDKKSNVSSAAFLIAQCLAFVSIEYCEYRLNSSSCNKDYKIGEIREVQRGMKWVERGSCIRFRPYKDGDTEYSHIMWNLTARAEAPWPTSCCTPPACTTSEALPTEMTASSSNIPTSSQLAVVLCEDPSNSTTTEATTETEMPTTTKKTTTTKPPNCAGANYEKIRRCCSEPPAIFINITNKKDKTCGISASNIKVFNTFILNKQQSTKKGWQNTVLINDTGAGRSLYPLAYFADCWLRAKGVMDNETRQINPEGMPLIYAANQSSYWSLHFARAGSLCIDAVQDYSPPKFVKDKKSNVSSAAFLITQCIAFVSIEYCEYRLNSSSCNKDYKMFDACKKYVFPNLIKQDESNKKFTASESAPRNVPENTV